MKNISKFFKSTLLMLALVLSASMMFACNKNGTDTQGPPDTTREDAKTEFVSIVVESMNSDWSQDLTNEQIASLDSCGSFVTSLYWTEFVSGVLYDSPLQTSKLQKINEVLSSDEGKALIADTLTNSDKFLPIVKMIGLTAEDVANLAYAGMLSLSLNGDTVLTTCKAKLEQVRLLPQTSAARDNLNFAIERVDTTQASSKQFAQTKDEIAVSLQSAEAGIKTISRFLFETAMLFESNDGGSFISALSTGALENASVSEIAVYAKSVLDSVSQMKEVFTEDEMVNLETALGLLVNDADWLIKSLSDTLENSLPVLSNLGMFLKGAYLTVDIFPTLCDLIGNAGNCLIQKNGAGVYSNLTDLITSLTNDQYFYADELAPNAAIVYSRMVLAALDIDYDEPDIQTLEEQIGLSKEWSKNTLNGLWANSGTDYQKLTVFYYCNLMIGVRTDTELEKAISDIAVYDLMLEAFESNFYKYIGSGGTEGATALRNSALRFINFASITGVSSSDEITREWFDKIYTATKAKLAAEVNTNKNAVKAYLDGYVEEFYDDTILDYIALANCDLIANTNPQGMQELVELIEKLNLAGFVNLK